MSHQNITNVRLVIGIVLISIGGIFLLENFGILSYDFGYYFTDYIFRWQTILIVIGGIILLSTENKSPGLVLVTIGVIGFIPELWPLLLVGIGLYILYRKNAQPSSERGAVDENMIDDVSIFGGGKKSISSQNFKGGKVTSIFGGSEIDLLDAQLASGDQTIELVAIFGGNTLIIPPEWNVKIDVVPIFGGISDKRRKAAIEQIDTSKRLIIRGTVLFGGAEIKD